MILRFYPNLILVFVAFGCSVIYRPGSSMTDVAFTIHPYIGEKSGFYYLTYQINKNDKESQLLRVIYHKTKNDRAYYFFSVPISHPEFGMLMERPLEKDGLTDFAKRVLSIGLIEMAAKSSWRSERNSFSIFEN
jgi:hypothetical protein